MKLTYIEDLKAPDKYQQSRLTVRKKKSIGVPPGNNGPISKVPEPGIPEVAQSKNNYTALAHTIGDELGSPDHSNARLQKYMGIGIGKGAISPTIAVNNITKRKL